MSKFDGKEHEVFFSKFMKVTIWTTIFSYSFTCFTMVLSYLLIKIFPLEKKKKSISIFALSLLSDP